MSNILPRHDVTTECYDVSICNTEQEDNLPDTAHSSASDFTVVLQPELNLHSILYLRAIEAETAISSLHVSTLPLTFSRLETCYVKMRLPLDPVTCNRHYNRYAITRLNEENLGISSQDQTCETTADTIAHVNDMLQFNVNFFIIARLLLCFFDADLLKLTIPNELSHADIRLLLRFIDIAVFQRKCFHDHLCQLAQVNNADVTNIDDMISYYDIRKTMSKAKEKETYVHSSCLKSLEERPKFTDPLFMKFDDLITIDLSQMSEGREAVIEVMKTETLHWAQNLGFTFHNGFVTEDGRNDFLDYIRANKSLITFGIAARSIILLEKERIDRRRASTLFQRDFLSLQLDRNEEKAIFVLQPELFLPLGCDITFLFPSLMSYALGTQINNHLVIGPINKDMRNHAEPRLTNTILAENQRLYCNVRTVPRILHFTSNIIAFKGRFTWPKNSNFDEHEILYSFMVDDASIKSRSITATNCIESYFKLKRTHLLLETMKFAIFDENMQLCHFAQKTYTKLALRIKPVTLL